MAHSSTALSVLQVSAKVNAKVQKDPQRILKVRMYMGYSLERIAYCRDCSLLCP